MSAGLPSDEVVDDYKNSLDDLVTNDRISIGNLTVIAKECIEHAQAIARVLENHILRVSRQSSEHSSDLRHYTFDALLTQHLQAPPVRKLPAFYVLDSIAKNVGTPYTVYFGLNLFHTYMNTFASVDNNVRRKLDEMRKTWSQPVPGSQSTYPVFQKTVTSKIDEAMENWARKQFPNRNPQMTARGPMAPIQSQPYRNTPTPPQRQTPVYPNSSGYQQYPNVNGANHMINNTQNYAPGLNNNLQMPTQYSQPPAPISTPQPYMPPQQPVPQQNFQYGQPSYPTPVPTTVDLDALNRDIDDLIVDAKIGSYSNPMDRASQHKLASLQSLKEIVDSGTLSQHDLADVRKSISEQLAARSNHRPTPPPVPTPQPTLSYPYQQPPVQAAPPPSSTPSFLNSASLAELLRATAPPPNQPTPPQVHATPVLPSFAPQQPFQPPPPAENALIAQLRASGLLPATPTPTTSGTPFTPPVNSTNSTTSISVKFTSTSFKTPRPELLRYIFEARPNRCNTCGRRFTSDEAGREKKARHLDWHFKTKTRLVEAERRGIQRSWYVDEREWIKSTEYEDDEGPAEEGNRDGSGPSSGLSPSSANGGAAKKHKEAFIRVPNDAKVRSEPCPICQEKFESVWSEELQDFIWRDAVKVGARVYHASCFREVRKDTRDREKDSSVGTPTGGGRNGNGRARTATPDSVLGKRERDAMGEGEMEKKIKVEE